MKVGEMRVNFLERKGNVALNFHIISLEKSIKYKRSTIILGMLYARLGRVLALHVRGQWSDSPHLRQFKRYI